MIHTKFDLRFDEDSDIRALCGKHPAAEGRHKGGYGKAKPLSAEDLEKVISFIKLHRQSPEADTVKLYLSVLAGLRACEIAGLRVSDVTKANGSTADVIQIRAHVTKGNRGREVPMNPLLKQAIEAFRCKYPDSEFLAVSHRYNAVKHQQTHAVTVWFSLLYEKCGLEGCSSHSGRRTFITMLARNLKAGQSLRDIQQIVGHCRLDTTQAYIECSPHQHDLVGVMSSLFDASKEGA